MQMANNKNNKSHTIKMEVNVMKLNQKMEKNKENISDTIKMEIKKMETELVDDK